MLVVGFFAKSRERSDRHERDPDCLLLTASSTISLFTRVKTNKETNERFGLRHCGVSLQSGGKLEMNPIAQYSINSFSPICVKMQTHMPVFSQESCS